MQKDVERGRPSAEAGAGNQVSGQAGDGQTSQSEEALDPRVVAQIQREVERRFQSAKDKRWAKLEKQYGELSQRHPEPQGQGDDLPGWIRTQVEKVVNQAGLVDDPGVQAILSGLEGDQDQSKHLQVLAELTEMALAKKGKGRISTAAVVLPGGGNAPHDLRQVYEQRKGKLRPGDVNALMALKREFREKGLEIY